MHKDGENVGDAVAGKRPLRELILKKMILAIDKF